MIGKQYRELRTKLKKENWGNLVQLPDFLTGPQRSVAAVAFFVTCSHANQNKHNL